MNDYEQEILRLRELLARERNVARTDALTGIGNRLLFEETLIQLPGDSVLILLDAANLHTANNVLGLSGGDTLLQRVAAAVREYDYVFRIGGDEFAVLLVGTTVEQARAVAERIQAQVGYTRLTDSAYFFVAAGVARAADRDGADAAMREDKKRRKNDLGTPTEVRS